MMTSESETPLTTHLTSLSTTRPYTAATKHPFLTSAGKGTLSSDALSVYLSQDRLYAAHAYPQLLGHILSSIPFSSLHALESSQEHLNRRIVKVVSGALQNVVREVGFFDEVAEKFELKLGGWKERKATRDYTAEMSRVGATGSVEDALVFLWAMERVYLDAWRYVQSVTALHQTDSEAGNAVAWLVSNWTNPEFVVFVDDLADLVNSLDVQPGSEAWARAEDIWGRVVELEEAFWPVDSEDELSLLRIQ